MKIRSAKLRIFKRSLIKPYVLSFTTVSEILSFVVEIILENGNRSIAEAVALPGYADETSSDIHEALAGVIIDLVGLDTLEATTLVNDRLQVRSFARSAILTAFELAVGDIKILQQNIKIPLIAPIATHDPATMLNNCYELMKIGYSTIKVKIGRNIIADIEGARVMLENLPKNIRFRFDANQGYDFVSAERFLTALDRQDNENVEFVEQPLPREQWAEMAKLAAVSHVPLMLDESIFDISDVKKAAEVGAKFIKLKLFKHAGITDLLNIARLASSMGLGVVIGNGVSSDLGNLIEAWAYVSSGDLFYGAFEGNGFVKLKECLLAKPPKVEAGCFTWYSNNLVRDIFELRKQ